MPSGYANNDSSFAVRFISKTIETYTLVAFGEFTCDGLEADIFLGLNFGRGSSFSI